MSALGDPTAARAAVTTEVAVAADFSAIRYAQCWEDADVLLAALDVQPAETCVSIASAGDNTLALLTRRPGRVVALDFSAAQLACLELRVAAYRTLEYAELLELIGSTPSVRRRVLYRRCRPLLTPAVRAFWDDRPQAVEAGIGAAGKFERYLALFREHMLPLVHSRRDVERLLMGGSIEQRHDFYARRWDTWRWRLLFRVFFSRAVMGRLGRDPSFFSYVEGSVASRILQRTRHALTELDPAANPYVGWILTGRHPHALPLALRPEHFETIRANLDRLEWHQASLEDYLTQVAAASCQRFNLSDIFEYMAPERYQSVLRQLARAGTPGARLVYWNMLVPRSRPADMSYALRPLDELAARLHQADKAFFYRALVVEEVL
jgi:S-adenosylmethionine-diacylglycerol 3-amino-3-carboxypropyl transferase